MFFTMVSAGPGTSLMDVGVMLVSVERIKCGFGRAYGVLVRIIKCGKA